MQCQLFRTETSKAVLELNYDYICAKAGTGRPLDYGNYRTCASTPGYNLWNWAPDPANHLAPHNKSNWLWKAERAALEPQRRDSSHNNLLIWNHFPSQGPEKNHSSIVWGQDRWPEKMRLHLEQDLSWLSNPSRAGIQGESSPRKPEGNDSSKKPQVIFMVLFLVGVTLTQIICMRSPGQLGELPFHFISFHSNLLQNHLLLSTRRGRLRVPEMNLKPKWSFVEEKGSVSGTALELPFQMCTLLTTRRNQWRAEAGGEKRRFTRTSERFAGLKGNSSAQGVNREGGHCPAPALGT